MLVTELIQVIFYILIVESARLSNDELQSIQSSCSPKDTCSTDNRNLTNYLMNWYNRHCFCDSLCFEYGDCCIDSNFYDRDNENVSFYNHECVRLKQYDNVYMKVTCKTGWLDQEIIEGCQLSSPPSLPIKFDPLRNLPVTSSDSKITYKNYFCAVCNNDSIALEFWKTQIECGQAVKNYNDKFENVTMKYIYNNLVRMVGKWGVYLDTKLSGKLEFNDCTVDPQIPPVSENLVRKCKCTVDYQEYEKCIRPISICSPRWGDPSTESLCHSYTAIIYDNMGVTYRNIHCALCNNVDRELLLCNNPKPSLVGTRFSWADFTKPFSLLFDFFDWGGSNVVGSKCNVDEVWDTAFKKCRNIICGKENHKPKFGECVPIGVNNESVRTKNSQTTDTSAGDDSKSGSAGVSSTTERMNVAVIFPD